METINANTFISAERRGPRSLRARLVFTNLLITLLAVAGMGTYLVYRTRETSTFLTGQLDQSVYDQALSSLEATGREQTTRLESFFAQIRRDTSNLGDALGRMLSQEPTGTINYWDAGTALFRLTSGSWDNPDDELASVFLPASVLLNENLLRELDSARQLDFVVPGILQSNPDVVALYFGGSSGETIYYPNINLAEIVPPDFDVTQRAWYLAANPAQNPEAASVWSVPYLDAALNGLVITSSIPIQDASGEFRGVAAMDVQLNRISDLVSAIRVGESGYALLVGNDMRILAMPDSAYADLGIDPAGLPLGEVLTEAQLASSRTSPEFWQALLRMSAGNTDLVTVEVGGTQRFLSFQPIPEIGYNLVIVVPVTELLAAAETVNEQIAEQNRSTLLVSLLVIGAMLLAAALATLFISNRLTHPLLALTRTAEDISLGNLNAVANVYTRDELGTLARAFNAMTARLRETIGGLENRIQERTGVLAHRAVQLQASAQVAREAAAQTDLNVLLSRTSDLISDLFGYYHTGIFLLDDSAEFAVLQAASSEGGKRMLERGHRLVVAYQGLVGAAVRQNKPQIIANVNAATDYYRNPDLPDTLSEAAFPLAIRGKVIGVLDIQAREENSFSPDDIQVIQTLGDQIAMAIQNTRLLIERETSIARLESATAQDTRDAWRRLVSDKQAAFRYTAVGLQPVAPLDQQARAKDSDPQALQVPISLRGQKIGQVVLRKKGSAEWTETDRNLALDVCTQIGLALENARLLEEAQRRASQEQTLSDLSSKLSRSLDIDTLLQTTLRELHRIPGITESSVVIAPASKPEDKGRA